MSVQTNRMLQIFKLIIENIDKSIFKLLILSFDIICFQYWTNQMLIINILYKLYENIYIYIIKKQVM